MKSLNLVIYCPLCRAQHIDKPHGAWANPPHRTHQCQKCGAAFRLEDYGELPTNGVASPRRAKFREACIYGFAQMFYYGFLTVNFRAVAAANIPAALITDVFNAAVTFYVIRRIATSEDSLPGFIGYVIGSMIGTYIGIVISS